MALLQPCSMRSRIALSNSTIREQGGRILQGIADRPERSALRIWSTGARAQTEQPNRAWLRLGRRHVVNGHKCCLLRPVCLHPADLLAGDRIGPGRLECDELNTLNGYGGRSKTWIAWKSSSIASLRSR